MSALPEIDYSKLSPGIRDTVMLLRSHGFETCDSGDGSNHAAGMKGATPFPMVAVRVGASMMAFNADSLRQLLIAQGVVFGDGPNDPRIEASYDPHNGVAMVLLSNVLIPGPLACPMCAPQCLPEEAAPRVSKTWKTQRRTGTPWCGASTGYSHGRGRSLRLGRELSRRGGVDCGSHLRRLAGRLQPGNR